MRDESDRSGIRVVIELKRGFNPHVVLNQLFKFTQLQQSFGIIMLALLDGKPEILTLKEMLRAYLEHQKEIMTRRSQFLLKRARDRAHLLEGLRIALDNLDRVIALIRGSADVEQAREGLMQEFALSEKQARAILEMRLQRLTALERDKLQEEYSCLVKEIAFLEALLADEHLIMQEIKKELLEVKEKYGDERRTMIVRDEGEIEMEDLIADEKWWLRLPTKGISNASRSNLTAARAVVAGVSWATLLGTKIL